MLDILKKIFNKDLNGGADKEIAPQGYDVRVATCALLVAIAKIDNEFTAAEAHRIVSVLKEKYGLSKVHADELIASAEQELEKSVDLWQFAHLINTNYSRQEKLDIVETLWRIVYVDGKMDDHEHYLMNKLKHLLNLSHDELINAKLKVKQSL